MNHGHLAFPSEFDASGISIPQLLGTRACISCPIQYDPAHPSLLARAISSAISSSQTQQSLLSAMNSIRVSNFTDNGFVGTVV
jgi:hypothetical protein